MSENSSLENLNEIQLRIHEWDKENNPDRHRLSKDSYSR